MPPTSAWSRRRFIAGGLGLAAAVVAGRLIPIYLHGRQRAIPGEIAGANSKAGHMLRQGTFPAAVDTVHTPVVIVGGGISGLSAARQLSRRGSNDFMLLELAGDTGGNAASGSNHVSAYPWGAHYLPVPDPRMKELLAFLEYCDSITGYDDHGLPVYNDFHLCAAPEERLYIQGTWQDGIIPRLGISSDDERQLKRFLAQAAAYRDAKEADGTDLFAIPIDTGSHGALRQELDSITIEAYLKREGYTSPYLLWYLDYCCRDDYGTTMHHTSAYAGLHYFASRKGKGANADHSDVLTWPEGNDFLARQLRRSFPTGAVRTGCVAYSVTPVGEEVEVLYYDTATATSHRILAQQAIMATPQYINSRIVKAPRELDYTAFTYAPWMIANVTLRDIPRGRGVPLAWDNVIYGSASLGYVNACQQHLSAMSRQRVLTYYLPLTGGEPRTERMKAYDRDHAYWAQLVMAELRATHVGIEPLVERMDMWLWGHGMIRPLPGFITGAARSAAQQSIGGRLHFAHTDLSGISIFEEAFYTGVRAARRVLSEGEADISEL